MEYAAAIAKNAAAQLEHVLQLQWGFPQRESPPVSAKGAGGGAGVREPSRIPNTHTGRDGYRLQGTR